MGSSDLPIAHFSGAAIAALLNFPLWRYATMAQAKYEVAGVGRATWGALLGPPYRGVAGIVGGMTVARGGIFLLSDVGTKALRRRGVEGPAAVVLPPLAASAVVQVLKAPIVRGGVMLQNPTNPSGTLLGTLRLLAATRGLRSLWHGTSAGLLKTAPKYCVAIAAKDALEARLPRAATPSDELLRDAAKAAAAAAPPSEQSAASAAQAAQAAQQLAAMGEQLAAAQAAQAARDVAHHRSNAATNETHPVGPHLTGPD